MIAGPVGTCPCSSATSDSNSTNRTGLSRWSGRTAVIVAGSTRALAVAVRTLGEEGYQTVEAEHGAAALAELERRAGAFDLVITDVSMPCLGGVELAREIQERWPNLPVVLMSGYPDGRTEAGSGVAATAAPFLQKPFTPERLLDITRATIAGSARLPESGR